MKNKKLLIGIGIVVLLAVVAIGIYKQHIQPTDDNVIRIGVILPLTGPVSDDGNELLRGIKIAEEKINSNSGNKIINVLVEDSKFDGKGAIVTYNSLVNKGVDAIIVAGDSPSQAISPLVSRAKIPAIATMISLNVTELSEWMFGGWFYVPETAAVMATYMRTVEKADEMAIFYNDTLHGIASMKAFKRTFENLGGRIVATVSYPPIATSVKSEIARLLESNPKGIYVTGFAQGMIASFNELAQIGYNGIICADNAASDNVVISNIAKYDGIRFIDLNFEEECINSEEARAVQQQYETMTNRGRVSSQALLAYQALTLLADALQAGGTSDEIKSRILTLDEKHTVVGKISYRKDRKLTMPLIVKQYGPNGEKMTLDTNIWKSVIPLE